jgi:hypothetical protein
MEHTMRRLFGATLGLGVIATAGSAGSDQSVGDGRCGIHFIRRSETDFAGVL